MDVQRLRKLRTFVANIDVARFCYESIYDDEGVGFDRYSTVGKAWNTIPSLSISGEVAAYLLFSPNACLDTIDTDSASSLLQLSVSLSDFLFGDNTDDDFLDPDKSEKYSRARHRAEFLLRLDVVIGYAMGLSKLSDSFENENVKRAEAQLHTAEAALQDAKRQAAQEFVESPVDWLAEARKVSEG